MNKEYKKRIESEDATCTQLRDPLTKEERKRMLKMTPEERDNFFYEVVMPRVRAQKD